MRLIFDMDGTIADLYSVDNWLEKLRREDPSPYLEAKPLVDMRQLSIKCAILQKYGCEIGIVTWLSKDSSKEYKKAVREAKAEWLRQHFPIDFDFVHMVQYGTSKNRFAEKDGFSFLVDDNDEILRKWQNGKGRTAIDAKIDFLKTLEFLRD